jgi:hypothetical protein
LWILITDNTNDIRKDRRDDKEVYIALVGLGTRTPIIKDIIDRAIIIGTILIKEDLNKLILPIEPI